MKNAEDICKELNWTFDSDPSRYNLFVGLIAPAIKLAQLDAIEETVKLCAENAKLSNEDKSYISYTYQDLASDEIIQVDEESILNCADILKKELE